MHSGKILFLTKNRISSMTLFITLFYLLEWYLLQYQFEYYSKSIIGVPFIIPLILTKQTPRISFSLLPLKIKPLHNVWQLIDLSADKGGIPKILNLRGPGKNGKNSNLWNGQEKWLKIILKFVTQPLEIITAMKRLQWVLNTVAAIKLRLRYFQFYLNGI